jgi:ABC-2 type transport system permease protein
VSDRSGMGGVFLRQTLLLAGKDLKLLWADKGTLGFSIVFPFLFVLLFSMVMGGSWTAEDKQYTVPVATAETGGSISRAIIDAMAGSEKGLRVVRLDPEDARDKLKKGKLGGYLFFPEGFSEAVKAGKPATITVYANPEATTNQAALTSVAGAIAAEFRSYTVMSKAIAELAGGPGGGVAPGGGGLPGGSGGVGVAIEIEKVGEIEPLRPVDFLVPGYLTMFVFFALTLMAESFVGERQNYTLERMVVASATRGALIAGKVLGSFTRGLVQVVFFWVAGKLVFDVHMGNHPAAVILISVLLTFAASGIGVFLATVAKSMKAAGSIAVFTSLSLAAFGGSWWPLFIMPQWLQNAARITPHAWANSAFNKLMLFGGSPANVVPEMIALTLFGVVFLSLGIWKFRIN